MKKIFGSSFLAILILIFFSNLTFAISYTWNGSTSSDWATGANWTPLGIPGIGDDVIIVAAPNFCQLDVDRTIDALTMTSGDLNLGGNTLIATLNTVFTAGNVSNGTLDINSSVTNTATFANTTFSVDLNLDVKSGRIFLNGGTYNGPVVMEQTGATDTGGNGNATFNNSFSFTLSGAGFFRTNGNNIFNQSVTLINNGSDYILLELTSGSVYNGTLTLINNSTSQIRMSYQGATQFNGNIEFNNTSTGIIRFCEQATASATFGVGVAMSIGGLGFTGGQLILKQITQADATNQSLTLTGATTLIENDLNIWDGDVSFVSPRNINTDCVFNGNVYLEKTADNADYSGGNTFNGNTTIVHSGFVNSFRFGRTNPDVFNGDLSLINLNDGHIRMADNSTGNQINGNLTVSNNSTNSVYFCNEATSDLVINGNVVLNSTGSSVLISIGTTGNPVTLSSGFTISAGTFDAGQVRFTEFTQLGRTPQNLVLSGSGNFTSNNSVWNGNLSVSSPRINATNSTFNGVTTLEKTGLIDENCGGNIFNQITTIRNLNNNAFRFGGTNPDIFNAQLFVQNLADGRIELARNSAGNEFNGNVSLENTGTDGIWFGENGGTSTLSVGNTISISGGGFINGQLRITGLTQIGGTAQNIITGASSRIRLSNCIYNGTVNYTSERIFLIANTFNNDVVFTKNGSGDDQSSGGNTFNALTQIINVSDGYLLFANTNPDIFNGQLTISNTGTSLIYLSHNAAGNQFNSNIIIESLGSNGIRIGDGGGTSTLAVGQTVTVGGLGFDSGEMRFRNFTQLGGTAQSLTLTGTARLLSMDSEWNGAVTFISPRIYFNGSIFNGVTYWEKTGATDDVCPGGDIFNSTATIANSGGNNLYTANTLPDIFNGTCNIKSLGSAFIFMAHASAGNQFNGNIIVESTGSNGIRFSQGGGDATLANGFTVSVGGLGFNSGELRFRNFTQVGNTPQNIILTGTGYFLNVTSTWNGPVNFSAPRFNTESTTYNNTANISKTGANNDNSQGGNTFNGITTISNSGSAQLLFANTNPDIFNAQLTLTNTSTDYIYMSYNSVGNMYNGNIIVQSNGSFGIRFGEGGSSTSTLSAGNTITVGGLGFDSGELRFRDFTQLSATAQNITLTGTSRLLSMESTWNGNTNFVSPRVYTRNSTYNGESIWSKTGATDDDSPGGNIFNATSTLTNSGTNRFRMGTTNPDIFNSTLTVTNTGSSQIWVADASAANQFNGNIIVESNNGVGIFFGRGGGNGTLAVGQTMTIGGLGFSTGELLIRNLTQSGATPQNLILTGTAYLNIYDDNWGGNVNFISPRLTTRGTTYNGLTYLEKNGGTNDASLGGNTFNQDVHFRVSGTGYFMPSNTVANTFVQDVTYEKTGTGLMHPSYNCESIYMGDININSNTAITFAANTNGRIIMSGGSSQSINDLGASPMPIFRRLRTDKTSGEVTLNIPIAISNQLDLVNGNIVSDLTNLLIVNDNATVLSVSDLAFVDGPVRKIGNDAFTFPIGKNGVYRPASISAPTNTAHHFTAEYFMIDPVIDGYSDLLFDAPLVYISDCEYWMINRTNGASNVVVTLSYKDYGTNGCSGVVDQSALRVARWDGTMWKDHGNGGTPGTASNGEILTSAAVTVFSPFTLATIDLINPLPVELVSFNAVPLISSVEIFWTTKSEVNNDFFVVERSADGVNFLQVGVVNGAGNSSHEINYNLIDVQPLEGVSFYRLKQVDFDGKFEYSQMVQVYYDGVAQTIVYPNPVASGQSIKINSLKESASKIEMKVYDATGRVVKVIESSNSEFQLDLPAGSYWIEWSYQGVVNKHQILIQ